jgi:phosphoribosylaminoimidazolecarboxamide formyltransferase / IMP cyclohydrolase
MRYGMNPHQGAVVIGAGGPVVVNGEPSMINYLDAMNAFALACETDRLSGRAAAVSFKHVSPAGAAVAGEVDQTAAETWNTPDVGDDSLLSAYVRARDANPKSSYGDVAAFSRPVDAQTADFLRTVFCHAVITPGFDPSTVDMLRGKRSGRFLILRQTRIGRSLGGSAETCSA